MVLYITWGMFHPERLLFTGFENENNKKQYKEYGLNPCWRTYEYGEHHDNNRCIHGVSYESVDTCGNELCIFFQFGSNVKVTKPVVVKCPKSKAQAHKKKRQSKGMLKEVLKAFGEVEHEPNESKLEKYKQFRIHGLDSID